MGRSRGPNYNPAVQELRRDARRARRDLRKAAEETPTDFRSSFGALGEASASFDPGSSTVTNQANPSSSLDRALKETSERLANFEQEGQQAADRARENFAEPLARQAQAQVGDLFANLGRSGRRNSAAQRQLAQFAEGESAEASESLFKLAQEARQQRLQELMNRQGAALDPQLSLFKAANNLGSQAASAAQARQQLLGSGAEASLSSSQQIADLMAQQEAQRARQRNSKQSSLLGSAFDIAGGLF